MTKLTSPQLCALLDILVHRETYSEVEAFKRPEAIDHYGYPFVANDEDKTTAKKKKSSSPLLQLLLTKALLPAPGIRDLSPDFWGTKFRGVMRSFGRAELSESYDKGTLGSRKRLASAASVIHESVTRGLLSGVANDPQPELQGRYDIKKSEDLARAWSDSVHQLVYGDLVDQLFDHLTKTEDFESHSPAIQGAAGYAILYLATFLHQVFVLSAEGPSLLQLLENLHRLIPYTVMGQTLRVGNAGTMINGIVRLFLAKVSVGAVSNWLGITSNATDGLNLMQRIISLVLDWDAGVFRKTIDSIKRSKDGATNEHLAIIDQHIHESRDHHEKVRQKSIKEEKSIIIAIFESSSDPKLAKDLTDSQHAECLQYHASMLAVRDREQISEVLCRQSPDLTTSIVREGVAVFEPMIRDIHKHVDLRKYVGAMETTLTDLIETSKPKKQETSRKKAEIVPPSIEDYVGLLKRNKHFLYEYLNDVAKGCPDIRDTWRDWAREAVKVFRRNSDKDANGASPTKKTDNGRASELDAGNMDLGLQQMVGKLPAEKQAPVREAIEAHSKYLSALDDMSSKRMQRIIDAMSAGEKKRQNGERSMIGPGVYASRWQSLLDATPITPDSRDGPLRYGKDVKDLRALGKPELASTPDAFDPSPVLEKERKARPTAPDVSVVVDALGSEFRTLVADISGKGLS